MSPPERAVDHERTRTEPDDVRSHPAEIDVGLPNSMFGRVLAGATPAAAFDKHDARITRPNSVVAGEQLAAADARVSMPSSREGSSKIHRSLGVEAPAAGINKVGFIDHSDGANLRTRPAEAGGEKARDDPLPPGTQVFVGGTHPTAPQWLYVTARLKTETVRGYVQAFRVTTDLPEPTAKLYSVKSGDTAEKLAAREFSTAVRDGHDLRYYENVLLFVNKAKGRAGITGAFQDPGLLGGGNNNVQLVAGHRIWLVSPAYASTLESVIPSGSLTGGAVAKLKRFAGHLMDILESVTGSPAYFAEVAGEYAQAIRDHLAEIIGIIAAFVAAEALSAFLAATPTGVGQIAAVVIQLGLAAFGAAGLVHASIEAVKHASNWLILAWTASGVPGKIAEASKEFLRMLVSIAMAALAYLGVKGNMANAVKIASSIPSGLVPATVLASGGQRGGGSVGAGVAIGPPSPFGPLGTASAMTGAGDGEPPSKDPKAEKPQQTAAERDWEKAEAEAKRQNADKDKPTRTEHGAIQEQKRGGLTAPEKVKLKGSAGHVQPDGATAKVLNEGGGRYTVVIVGDDGVLVTVIRNKTAAEVKGLSSRYQWYPPW
jgi:hypothetical protein